MFSDDPVTIVGEDNIWLDINKLDIRIYNKGPDLTDNTSHPLIPFDPNLEKHPIKPMKIIYDLPNMKQLEFNHQYMYEHLEQHSLNPT